MSDKIIDLNSDNFNQTIDSSTKLVVVDFWAKWCAPCIAMGNALKDLAEDKAITKIAQICKFQLDDPKRSTDAKRRDQEFIAQFDIQGIPTLLFFKNGKKVEKMKGLSFKEDIKKTIEKLASEV